MLRQADCDLSIVRDFYQQKKKFDFFFAIFQVLLLQNPLRKVIASVSDPFLALLLSLLFNKLRIVTTLYLLSLFIISPLSLCISSPPLHLYLLPLSFHLPFFLQLFKSPLSLSSPCFLFKTFAFLCNFHWFFMISISNITFCLFVFNFLS